MLLEILIKVTFLNRLVDLLLLMRIDALYLCTHAVSRRLALLRRNPRLLVLMSRRLVIVLFDCVALKCR